MPAIKGQRGSWHALAGGEKLPCVHKEWYVPNKYGKPYYFDKGIQPGQKKADDLVESIKNKRRVILTNDIHHGEGKFQRTKPIAIFEVDNIIFDENGLKFDFTKRVDEAQ